MLCPITFNILRGSLMIIIRSNKALYFLHRYMPLYMLFFLWTLLWKSGNLEVQKIVTWFVLSSALTLYYVFRARFITIATITPEGIIVKKDRLFLWSDIKSVRRVSQLYTMKLKTTRKIYIFPIDHLAGLGTFYSDSTMEQKINLMKNKYSI